MKCWCCDLITVDMNVEETCRFGKDIYDCKIWIFMKCEKYTNFGEMMNKGLIACKWLYVHDNMINSDWDAHDVLIN